MIDNLLDLLTNENPIYPIISGFEGCSFHRIKVKNRPDESSILVEDVCIVRVVDVFLNLIQDRLKSESVPHDVEQKGKNECAYIVVKLLKLFGTVRDHVDSHLLAIDERGSELPRDSFGKVHHRSLPVLPCKVTDVVPEIEHVINEVDDVQQARLTALKEGL